MTVSGTGAAGAVLTAEEMLANARAAAANGDSANKSAVQKLLDAHPETDTVELSPVAKLLAAQQKAAPASTSYTDQDWYIRAKVAQLKGQIALYSTLPNLDPSGGVMDGLTKEINDLVKKQQDKLKATQAEAAAKQAELAKAQADNYKGFSSNDLLSRSKSLATTGKLPDDPISSEAQALLDKLNGVNKTV
jgi:hypothetical protein